MHPYARTENHILFEEKNDVELHVSINFTLHLLD